MTMEIRWAAIIESKMISNVLFFFKCNNILIQTLDKVDILRPKKLVDFIQEFTDKELQNGTAKQGCLETKISHKDVDLK